MANRLQYVAAGRGMNLFTCNVIVRVHRYFVQTIVESKIRYSIKVSSTFFCVHMKFLIYICLVLGESQEVADHQSHACRPLYGGRQTQAVSGQTNQQNWSNYHRPHIKIPNGVYRILLKNLSW